MLQSSCTFRDYERWRDSWIEALVIAESIVIEIPKNKFFFREASILTAMSVTSIHTIIASANTAIAAVISKTRRFNPMLRNSPLRAARCIPPLSDAKSTTQRIAPDLGTNVQGMETLFSYYRSVVLRTVVSRCRETSSNFP